MHVTDWLPTLYTLAGGDERVVKIRKLYVKFVKLMR